MRRRGAGVAAVKNKNLAQARFRNKGEELASDQIAQLSKQMAAFQTNLEEFARKHKDEIRRDAHFRTQFQEMCASIGVDPLASGKGFWSELLGVGDFYYELGVQIIEVCMATSHRNGGLLTLEELKERLTASRGRTGPSISVNDLLTAIKKLKVLGSGFALIPVGQSFLVQSVPGELTMDHTMVLQQAQKAGYVTVIQLVRFLAWETTRAERALEYLVKEGLAWVDDQAGTDRQYWFPSLCSTLHS